MVIVIVDICDKFVPKVFDVPKLTEIQKFRFQVSKETLHHGVVQAIPLTTHTLSHVVLR